MVFQWAVRVSQRLQSRSLQSGESRTFSLVQIVLEASKNRGFSQTLGCQSLYMTGAVAACFDGYGDGHCSRTHRQHHIQNVALNLCYTLKKSLFCVWLRCYSVFWRLWRRALQWYASTTPYTKCSTQPVLFTQEIPVLRMTGADAPCFDGYGDGHCSRTHRQHHIQNVVLNLCYTLKKSLFCVWLALWQGVLTAMETGIAVERIDNTIYKI